MTTETKEPAEPKGMRPGGRRKAKTAKTTITCDSCFYYQRLGGGVAKAPAYGGGR